MSAKKMTSLQYAYCQLTGKLNCLYLLIINTKTTEIIFMEKLVMLVLIVNNCFISMSLFENKMLLVHLTPVLSSNEVDLLCHSRSRFFLVSIF